MLRIDFLNAGCADAILLRETETPFTMLVDCGDTPEITRRNSTAGISAADFLKRENVARIDLLVITHLHADHNGGLPEIAETAEIGTLWSTWVPDAAYAGEALPDGWEAYSRTLEAYAQTIFALRARGTKVLEQRENLRGWKPAPALSLDVDPIDPYRYFRQKRLLSAVMAGNAEPHELWFCKTFLNAAGIRLSLTYQEQRILLPGDVYGMLLEDTETAPCTILKTPHHGSAYAVTGKLMQTLRPALSVVTATRGAKDDRPTPETDALLRRYSGRVAYTDENSAPSVSVILP